MVVIFPVKAIFKPFRFEGSKISIVFQMPLEFNLFIFLACKWDIVPLRVKEKKKIFFFIIIIIIIQIMHCCECVSAWPVHEV